MFKIYKLLLVMFFSLIFQIGQAQDYKFHSVFIYNFTKYIEWPSSYKSGEFVIGVLGKSTVSDKLKEMAAIKSVGSQPISVKEYSSVEEIGKCHILFIPDNKSNFLENAIAKFTSSPTLLITEKAGMGKKGSGINFVLQGGKWKFELNKTALEQAQLKVATDLEKLAIVI
ncbi:MAG: YfiR family protein [Candidatus Cyclobacteriaceae bacterium M3_2C_046]